MSPDKLMMFSKHIQGVPLEEAAGWVRDIGTLSSLDLTVRPGGHVEPARVREDLPRAVECLKRCGLGVGMLTTNITDASDPLTEAILRTAGELGIRYYKLGYWDYRGFGTLAKRREEVAARLKDLSAMNLQLGMHGGFHNHSDTFFGASLWDVEYVLRQTDARAIGVYFDPAHAVIEGGSSGWMMGMDLLASRITMLAVKDFRWVEGKHRYAGGRRHSVEFCPLADGNTPWEKVIDLLGRIGFDGPVSFHSEYQGSHSYADLTPREVVKQTARDVELFGRWMGQPKG